MTAQAFIFDLSALSDVKPARNALGAPAKLDADRLLHDAVERGLPCALISALPYRQAKQQLRRRFGDTAHHIFSVVLTDADFAARGHKGPYSVVLNQMGMQPDEALAVTASPLAIAAAKSARVDVRT